MTVVRGGAGIPCAEPEKPSKSGRRERLRDEGREGETGFGSEFEELRVAEDPPRASRAGD
jgi:hypothetical protein